MYCKKCNFDNPGDEEYCSSCFGKLNSNEPPIILFFYRLPSVLPSVLIWLSIGISMLYILNLIPFIDFQKMDNRWSVTNKVGIVLLIITMICSVLFLFTMHKRKKSKGFIIGFLLAIGICFLLCNAGPGPVGP